MIVHDKDRRFKLTVGASMKIAELCPDGDMNRLKEVLTGSYASIMKNVVAIILALQAGYEDAKAYDDPTYTPDYMTEEEIATLEPADFQRLETEAIAAYVADSKPTVEVEYKKK